MKLPTRSSDARRVVGIIALFSGVALLAHILTNVSLQLGLLLTALMAIGGFIVAIKRSDPEERMVIIKIACLGIVVGLLSTTMYDVTKYFLAKLDPSPYNPYEAIRVFGSLLIGEQATYVNQMIAGTMFHFLNGTCFAIAYAFLFKKHGFVSGILWGIFLESFQLALYPGWLNIKFYTEFVQISFLSHMVYGAMLGLGIQYGFRKMAIVKFKNE